MDRRKFIIGAMAAGVAATTLAKNEKNTIKESESNKRPSSGKIKQVLAGWCFMMQGPKWDIETFCKNTSELGCVGVELVQPEHWDVLKKHKLICAAVPSHKFIRGMNNPLHWEECHQQLEEAILNASRAGFPNVMTFTGYSDTSKDKGSKVSLEEGIKNCVDGYKKIIGLAEKKNITLVLEPLNTRDSVSMKGHPGYMGNHVDICMDIIKKVGSNHLKLLFDVYHIQIMDGDIIRRIDELKNYIGHVQIAGVPGRGPLSKEQELNYSAVMTALHNSGYKGYVGHEWIPTGDAIKQLRESVLECTI